MFDGIINAITDFVRGLLYGVAETFLFILDIIWEAIHKLITLDLSDYLDNWFLLIMTLVGFFMLLRVAKIAMKVYFDQEYRIRFSITNLIMKFFVASVLISMIPFAFSYCNKVTIGLINNISAFIPYTAVTSPEPDDSTGNEVVDSFLDLVGAFENMGSSSDIDDLKPSTVMLQVGRINMRDVDADLAPVIDVTADDFDINEKSDGNYVYFSTWSSLFLLIVESILCCYIFVLIGITVGKRLFDIAYKYLLAPYVVAASIEPDDRTFGLWVKLLIADFITNFAQIYAVYFVLYLCNNATIQGMLGQDAVGIIAQIFLFIAGLMAAMSLPQTISTIIGGYSAGTAQAMSDLRTGLGLLAGTNRLVTSGIGGTIAGAGLGALGGAIGGASNNFRSTGSNAKAFAGGMMGAFTGVGSAVKTNLTGGRLGGGIARGRAILKSGIDSARPKNKNGVSPNDGMGDNVQSGMSGASYTGASTNENMNYMNTGFDSEIPASVNDHGTLDGTNQYAQSNNSSRASQQNVLAHDEIHSSNIDQTTSDFEKERPETRNRDRAQQWSGLFDRRSREISPDNDLDMYVNNRKNRLG